MIEQLLFKHSSALDEQAAIDGLVGHTHNVVVRTTEFPDLEKITDAADAAKHGRLASLVARPRHVERIDQLKVSPSLFTVPFGRGVFAEAADVFVRMGG
jgi:hypothetical protein